MEVIPLHYNHQKPDDCLAYNVTSWTEHWSGRLSPYDLGPVNICGDINSLNLENAFQYSKLYPSLADNGLPTLDWWLWAQEGWNKKQAIHYPMGREAKDLGFVKILACDSNSFNYEMISHQEARNTFFVENYAKLVTKTKEYQRLKDIVNSTDKVVYLLDFEGYPYVPQNYQEVLKSDQPFGQGMVLSWLFLGILSEEGQFLV